MSIAADLLRFFRYFAALAALASLLACASGVAFASAPLALPLAAQTSASILALASALAQGLVSACDHSSHECRKARWYPSTAPVIRCSNANEKSPRGQRSMAHFNLGLLE